MKYFGKTPDNLIHPAMRKLDTNYPRRVKKIPRSTGQKIESQELLKAAVNLEDKAQIQGHWKEKLQNKIR